MFYTLRLLLGLAEAGTFPGLWYQLTLFFSTAEVPAVMRCRCAELRIIYAGALIIRRITECRASTRGATTLALLLDCLRTCLPVGQLLHLQVRQVTAD